MMQIRFPAIVLAILAALVLSACGNVPSRDTAPAAEAGAALLTPEARQALAAAEADWQKAKAEFALWTTADKAFKDAQEAAGAGNSAAVLRLAKQVSALVALAMEQKHYPSTEMK